MKDKVKSAIKVKWRDLEWFQPEDFKRPDNIGKLKASLKKNGMYDAFKIWRRGGKLLILDGHIRQMCMKELEAEGEPIPDEFTGLVLDIKNEREAKKVVLACNSHYAAITRDGLADFIGDDFGLEELTAEFEIPGLDFSDVFDDDEIEEDEIPAPPKKPITKLGDLWQLGRHRLLCGDATNADDVARLMGGKKADMCFIDPPYGISIVGKAGNIGGSKVFGNNERAVAFGSKKKIIKAGVYPKVKNDDSTETAIRAISIIEELKIKNVIVWGGNYFANELPPASCWIVWDKQTDGHFADGEIAWTNIKKAISIFRHKWSGVIKDSERGEKRSHPTQKPVALAAWCFEKYGKKNDAILDTFMGSGPTLIASEQLERTCYGMEIEPAYCDVVKIRWENLTGKKAKLLTK